MDLLEFLDQLDRLHIDGSLVAGKGPGPKLALDGPLDAFTDELVAAIKEHRDLLIVVMLGRTSGHVLAPCSECGELSSVHTDASGNRAWPTCRLTPRCPGRHIPRDVDVARVARTRRPRIPRRPKTTDDRQRQPYPINSGDAA